MVTTFAPPPFFKITPFPFRWQPPHPFLEISLLPSGIAFRAIFFAFRKTSFLISTLIKLHFVHDNYAKKMKKGGFYGYVIKFLYTKSLPPTMLPICKGVYTWVSPSILLPPPPSVPEIYKMGKRDPGGNFFQVKCPTPPHFKFEGSLLYTQFPP